jgi:hypothetical protein
VSLVAETCQRLSSLRGASVKRAKIVEMAIAEKDDAGSPIFRHAGLPFIQAISIELELADGRYACFGNYQNDSDFPISLDISRSTSIEDHWNAAEREGEPSIYRFVTDPEFIEGDIVAAEARLDKAGNIFEVELGIGDRQVLLHAGEVIEHGELRVAACDMGGSILLFRDARDVAAARLNEIVTLD